MKHVLSKLKHVLFGALLFAGCQGPPAIDERLLSCLEEARAWQHRADVHLADGAISDAVHDVEQVLHVPFPAGAPEGEEARLDAYARLAKLLLGLGDEKRALEQVALGRREASFDSFYRAHVETVAGEIFEARAKRSSDADEIKAARKEALAAYERSIAINKQVQARLARQSR